MSSGLGYKSDRLVYIIHTYIHTHIRIYIDSAYTRIRIIRYKRLLRWRWLIPDNHLALTIERPYQKIRSRRHHRGGRLDFSTPSTLDHLSASEPSYVSYNMYRVSEKWRASLSGRLFADRFRAEFAQVWNIHVFISRVWNYTLFRRMCRKSKEWAFAWCIPLISWSSRFVRFSTFPYFSRGEWCMAAWIKFALSVFFRFFISEIKNSTRIRTSMFEYILQWRIYFYSVQFKNERYNKGDPEMGEGPMRKTSYELILFQQNCLKNQ